MINAAIPIPINAKKSDFLTRHADNTLPNVITIGLKIILSYIREKKRLFSRFIPALIK